MKRFLFCSFFIGSVLTAGAPQDALKKLQEGNSRFVQNNTKNCNFAGDRREALKDSQAPFAVVVGCSDSRVPLEIIFDQGLGDLFGVRNAGNVVGPIEINSIDYAVLVLKAPLIVVMGHESCGAVRAVLSGNTQGVEAIAELITKALPSKKVDIEQAVIDNVRYGVEKIKSSKDLGPLIKEGKLEVIGAYYHFATGKVDFLN